LFAAIGGRIDAHEQPLLRETQRHNPHPLIFMFCSYLDITPELRCTRPVQPGNESGGTGGRFV